MDAQVALKEKPHYPCLNIFLAIYRLSYVTIYGEFPELAFVKVLKIIVLHGGV